MRLRPRYSLLSLLILTALVAGGVKLWRWPHWRMLSDSPTASEQALLDQLPSYPKMVRQFPEVTSCQYLNTFDGQKLLLIKGQPAPSVELFVETFQELRKQNESTHPNLLLLDRDMSMLLPSTLLLNDMPRPREKILCWYSICRPHVPTTITSGDGANYLPSFFATCYYVSDLKQVYLTNHASMVISVSRIQASQIQDLELRALIEEELLKIPDEK